MKHFYSKLKLFLVALFALVGMGAWATTATTKYVLGEALAPSQLFADGKYYINNVGTGKYLAAGGSWGTHAVVNADGLDYTITYADGKYTLDSQVSNGGDNHFLNGEWNDGAAMGWIFAEVSEGVYTISNGTNFLTAGENGVVTLADDATADAAKWTLKTLADRIAELTAATAEAPVDATFLIQDANFGRNDLRKSAWTMVASNQNLSGGEDNNGSVGNNCAESYHSTFTLSQTLANAPAGKYKMTAQGFYRQDDGATEDLPVFYANDKTANFPAKTGSEGSMTDASKSFSAGQYTIEPIEVTVFEDGQLTVGAKGTAVHQWVIFDNFRLSYLGSEIPAEEFAPAYDTALSNAKKALDDETYAAVTGVEKTALAAAVETYSTVEETVDAYKAAISALTAATTTFTGAKADYDALVAAKAANAERSYAYADADKKAAAEASLTVEATSAADAKEKATAIWTAFRKYADSHALAEGVEGAINMTDHIVNPNAAEAIAEPWTVVKGEGSGGSLTILNGEPLTDGEGNTYKYFDGGDWNANAWDVALKQTITLPAGKYMITASGRASADVQLSLLVGEEKTAIPAIGATGGLFGRGWDDASLEFVVTEDGEVAIGVQGVTSNQYNWMSFTRFRLVCLEKSEAPAPTNYNVVVVEREHGTVVAEPTTAEAGATVTIKVTPDEGYMVDEVHVTYGDDQTIDWESLDMETLTGTIIMPAADVNVLFTFKEVEDEEPEVKATLVHTAGTAWGNNTGKNTVDTAAEYYNNEASSAWAGAAFAEFDFSNLPNGATITEATLFWNATNINVGGARDNKVYYLNVGQTIDYADILANENAHLYTGVKTFLENVVAPKGSASIEGKTMAADALNALIAAGQKTIIFQFTGNGGGANLHGKAAEDAPQLVIKYLPGAPEVPNASFEADGEKAASNAALEMTGWTEVIDGSYNNTELRPAGSASTTSPYGTSNPSEGDYSLFVRHGWNGGGNAITLTSDALAEIPAGDYTLSVDYKQHYGYDQDNQQNENTKVSISLKNGEEVLGSETSPAAPGSKDDAGDATYFNDAEWSTLTASFTLDEPVAAGAKVVITLNAAGARRSDFFLDNVKFVKIPGVEAAKLELQKAIEAAQAEVAKYMVGEDLFMYPESEIAPLNTAIATATEAYNDAEATKESLNTATETLNAFVAAFAPAFNAPDADKLYTFQLRLDGENPLYMNLGEGITIAEEATALKFIATENAGQYYLANEDETLFVGLAGGNAWTMSTAAEKKAAWTFTALGEGAYRINNLVTVGRFVGTNAGEKTAGSTCYADKQTSNGNVDWLIAEYVAPVDPNDYTDRIVNADLTGEGGFDATGTKGIDGSGIVKVGSAAAFDFKQTIANLPAGKYMVTAQAAYRYGADEKAEYDAIQNEDVITKLVQLYATVGTKTVKQLVQNRYDGASETDYADGNGSTTVNGKFVPNSSDAVKAWFTAGQYVNEVVFNLPADGAVTIGINRTGTPESDYTVIGPWTLTRLGDAEEEPEPEPEPLNPGDDATSFITNPSFETGDLTGWTVGSSSDTGVKPNSNATYTTEGCDGDYLFNTWWQGIPITQKVTGLPNGLYELKALMANDAITAGNQPCLYLLANGEHSDAFGSETAGKFAEGSMQFYVLDGTATIGAIGGNADGSFNESGYYWYKVDNFRLTYVEGLPNIDDVVIPEGKMSNAAAAAITTAKEAGDVIALLTAVEAAKASIAAYASAKSLLDDVDEVLANTNVYTAEAYETYTTAHATWTAKYEDGTLTDEEAASLRKDILPSRYIMGVDTWHWANTTDDFLLSAWTVDEVQAHEFDTKLYINMWSMEGYTDGSDFKVPFFEYWTGDGDSLGEATLKATISGLTAGETAEVDIWVRVRAKNGVAAADATGITLQVNDGEPVDVTEGDVIGDSQFSVEKYTATGVIGEDGKLFIKLKVAAENNISWLSFKDVTYSLSTIPTAITDVKGVKNVGSIYDLSGRKVEKMVKGVYIVNGKKVTVK